MLGLFKATLKEIILQRGKKINTLRIDRKTIFILHVLVVGLLKLKSHVILDIHTNNLLATIYTEAQDRKRFLCFRIGSVCPWFVRTSTCLIIFMQMSIPTSDLASRT